MLKFGKKELKKTLIGIVSSDQAKIELEELLEGSGEYQVKIKQTPDVYEHGRALVNGSADVVIIEADAEDPRSEAVLKELCRYVSKDGAMIVISSEPSIQTVRNLFKIGVSDVLPLPLNPNEFYKSIKSASETKRNRSSLPEQEGKVIAISKSNGGVGSTTIALNVARHISKSEAFIPPHGGTPRVAVFDFNIQFGAIALNLNLKNRTNLLTVLQAESRLDEDLLYASIVKHETGISVLAAPDEIVPGNAFSPEFIETVLHLARQMFDYVIIDMPLVWTGWTPKVYHEVDAVITVLQPFVEHVQTMSKFFDGLNRLDIDREKTMIVLNEVGKGPVFKQRADQIEKRFKRPMCQRRKEDVLHKLASDRGVFLDKAGANKHVLKELDQICQSLKTLLDSSAVEMPGNKSVQDNQPNYLRAN